MLINRNMDTLYSSADFDTYMRAIYGGVYVNTYMNHPINKLFDIKLYNTVDTRPYIACMDMMDERKMTQFKEFFKTCLVKNQWPVDDDIYALVKIDIDLQVLLIVCLQYFFLL